MLWVWFGKEPTGSAGRNCSNLGLFPFLIGAVPVDFVSKVFRVCVELIGHLSAVATC